MAKKIEAWTAFGPRLEPKEPMDDEGLIQRIVLATNQSRGSVKAVLDELDVQNELALKDGQIVQLPNGTHYRPVGKADGSVDIQVRVNPDLVKRINSDFRGKWRNAENIGKTEAEIFALWNAAHPDDLIEM